MTQLVWICAVLLIGYNLLVFSLYGIDKLKAKKTSWRVSEKTLLWMAFLGGSAGAFLGMQVFHHKTLHKKFEVLVPLFLLLHACCLGALLFVL